MDIYKDYIQKMRRLSFKEVYILIGEDLTPTLKHFVQLLTLVKFEASSYFLLYNEFKKIISSFLVFHLKSTDAIVKEADRYAHVVDSKEELLKLVEETISTHQENQKTFAKEFLPAKNAEEKRIYEEIESGFNCFMKKVYDFRKRIIKFTNKEQVDELAAVHFERAAVNTSKFFNFTNIFIAMLLADRMEEIRFSIEEICTRMSNNLKEIHEVFKTSHHELVHQLYDRNKEGLMQSRRERICSIETAEVNKSIQIVHKKLEQFVSENLLTRLENEVAYWQTRVQQFHMIRDNLLKLKAEQDNIIEQEKIYNSLECFDPPGGSKRKAWVNMGLNYAERKENIKEMIIRESRALITFFAVRGYDRILYKDNKGFYYVDELKHQIYVSNHALTLRHVNCEGELVKVEEKPYYFDENGRYIKENGEKIYQCAPCSSQYKLGEDNLFKKISKDCGHADARNKQCKMMIKDPDLYERLPDFLPMDIKESLDAETVKYLWDSFGSLLPDALYDVCMKKPRNPIHMLAHRLIHHKYSRTTKELAEKKKEAEEYRLNIFKRRHEKDVEASMAWQSKQTKRRKPEESDDFMERAVFNAQQAERDFINYLNYCDNEL